MIIELWYMTDRNASLALYIHFHLDEDTDLSKRVSYSAVLKVPCSVRFEGTIGGLSGIECHPRLLRECHSRPLGQS